jgi:hypothetical protein
MTTLSIKLDDERAKYLKKMSHYLSIERDEDLTLSDLVREALENSFPMPKHNDEQSENN